MRHATVLGSTLAILCALGVIGCGRSEPASSAPPASTSTAAPSTPSGGAPAAAGTTPGTRLYVSDETGGHVFAIDADSGQVIEKIAVGKRPRGIKLSRDGRSCSSRCPGRRSPGPG